MSFCFLIFFGFLFWQIAIAEGWNPNSYPPPVLKLLKLHEIILHILLEGIIAFKFSDRRGITTVICSKQFHFFISWLLIYVVNIMISLLILQFNYMAFYGWKKSIFMWQFVKWWRRSVVLLNFFLKLDFYLGICFYHFKKTNIYCKKHVQQVLKPQYNQSISNVQWLNLQLKQMNTRLSKVYFPN